MAEKHKANQSISYDDRNSLPKMYVFDILRTTDLGLTQVPRTDFTKMPF